MHETNTKRLAITTTILILASTPAIAMEPPTAEQLERYRTDGTLTERADAARAFGNHLMAPQLAARFLGEEAVKALPEAPTVLPASGSPRVLTLLIAFEDMLGYTDPAVVEDRILGDGEPSAFPYESLTAFYRRSSYEQLEIGGSVLGWYTTPYPRENVVESFVGRQSLIKEVFTHYDIQGHDFSQYDNDGDGVIDYLAVVWTGPHGEWAEFWWGYQTRFWNDNFTVDGVRIGTYSWQWENYNWPGQFSPEVLIHETGHSLGLPDYYDYDNSVGPRGGCGGLDQMDGNWGDHNAFSKWVLGWLSPEIHNQDLHDLGLSPSSIEPEAAVLMHGDAVTDPYAEFFVVEHRRRVANDTDFPNDGLLIWHVDARLDDDGRFLYNNSYTEHKLLRLMEADGLEEIAGGGRADADDYYVEGDIFDPTTTPNSNRHDGVPTNIAIDSITDGETTMGLRADLGSGCALWCDASVTPNAWPGLPVTFNGSLDTANCDGSPSYGWVFGDGGSSGDTSATHTYVSTGTYDWSVTAQLGDATCGHGGPIVVCTDFKCWRWAQLDPMLYSRAGHAAVALDDARIFLIGDITGPPEIYDSRAGTSSQTAMPPTPFVEAVAARLADGRVLVTGAASIEDYHTAIYDPATDSWTDTGHLNVDRVAHSALTLSDGRVIVAGGFAGASTSNPVEEVEVYDPVSGAWTIVGARPGLRLYPGLTNLNDGRALIVGAREGTLFDPLSDTLSRATALPGDWQLPIAITLDDGRVLLCGINDGTLTLLWNPSDGRLTLADPVSHVRRGSRATKVPNGLVLVTGGDDFSGNIFDATEIFDPQSLAWTNGSSLVTGRVAHAATLTTDGTLVLTGGLKETAVGNTVTFETEVLVQPTSPPRNIGGRTTP